MPTSESTKIARSWLQSGHAPSQRANETAYALLLLSGEVTVNSQTYKPSLQADLEMALLLEADAAGRIDLVQLLSEHARHKPTAKHSKKLLFRAKQRGIAVPEKKPTRAPVDLSAVPEPLPSFASSFDGMGDQLVFLGGWSASDGPYSVVAILNDRDGLQSAYYLPDTSRTQQREMLGRLQGQFAGFTTQVADAFAAGRIRWALNQRDAAGRSFEGDAAEVRRLLSQVEPIQDLDIALDPEDEAQIERRIELGRELVEEACFGAWLSPDRALQAALTQDLTPIRADETLDAEAAQAKVLAARTSAVERGLPEAERIRIAQRFEITASLLASEGKLESAMRAIATARGLRDLTRSAMSLGFVQAAADRHLPLPRLLAWVRREAATLFPEGRDNRTLSA